MISKAELRGVLTGLSLVAVALLVAISGPILVPGQELLSSLRFHVGLALLALPLALLVVGAWRRALLVLLLVGASLGQGGWIVWQQQAGRAELQERAALATLEVMSFNVLAYNERGADIASYVLQSAPDLLVTMESNAIMGQLDELAADYPYRAGCNPQGDDCDLMVFSRTPLADVVVQKLEPFQRLRLVSARTVVDGQSVTIVGIHLSKPYFDEAAWVELMQLRETLRDIDGPVIVAGDFNAAAWSDTVADFVARAELVPPPLYPATWPIRLGKLGVPIDNMFTGGDALIESIAAFDDSLGSNHRGLLASVQLLGPAN
ncbi:endonuclease/exonuclease/phosphatase family protein [Devosia sp. SL43]|uniref:endonuclease/exonuclease/phosphatase family protein n=1 Tax=Devosia sp. SL43 TaxID=2806348 RepID=UPI001F26A07C|nr:endonuclease/exonuclease/phosphatase family protein [Devosia sp. SL43]UJW86685.1 endonuclease/exonuclease/phosphatase family protein [Devosia sp. SL43]